MSDRAERMLATCDCCCWICPSWCTQPDAEDGEHVGVATHTAASGVEFEVHCSAPWHREGVGGPVFVEIVVSAGGTVAVEDLDAAATLASQCETAAEQWHYVWENIGAGLASGHYLEAWPGARDAWLATPGDEESEEEEDEDEDEDEEENDDDADD